VELIGVGDCYGSFGELLQGVLPGNKKFLVNLQIKNSARAKVHLMPSAYSIEKEALFAESYRAYSKSYKVARNILVDIGRHDDCFLEIDSDIPVGKGCSSSTADMIASIRALASAFSLALKPDYISRMLTEIEPNDGLHYKGSVVYHHTTGELIARYNYVPPLKILGIDFGGTIDTVEFNNTPINWSDAEIEHYEVLLNATQKAFIEEDIDRLCEIATESTFLWDKLNPKHHLQDVMQFMRDTGGLGIVNTHSGTYLGVLYRDEIIDIDEIQSQIPSSIAAIDLNWFETVSCSSTLK